MAEVVGVIQSVAGQIEHLLGSQLLLPHRRHVDQRHPRADERFQLVAVAVEHLARRVDPLVVAEHRRHEDDLGVGAFFLDARHEARRLVAIPGRIAAADVVHPVGHEDEVWLRLQQRVEIGHAIGHAPARHRPVDMRHAAFRAHAQLRHDKLRPARLEGGRACRLRRVEAGGDAVATDADPHRLPCPEPGPGLRQAAMDDLDRRSVGRPAGATVGDFDVMVVEPAAGAVEEPFLWVTDAVPVGVCRVLREVAVAIENRRHRRRQRKDDLSAPRRVLPRRARLDRPRSVSGRHGEDRLGREGEAGAGRLGGTCPPEDAALPPDGVALPGGLEEMEVSKKKRRRLDPLRNCGKSIEEDTAPERCRATLADRGKMSARVHVAAGIPLK